MPLWHEHAPTPLLRRSQEGITANVHLLGQKFHVQQSSFNAFLAIIGAGAVNVELHLTVQLAELADMLREKGHTRGFTAADGDLIRQLRI